MVADLVKSHKTNIGQQAISIKEDGTPQRSQHLYVHSFLQRTLAMVIDDND